MRVPDSLRSLFCAGLWLALAIPALVAKPVAPLAVEATATMPRALPADPAALGDEPLGEPQFNTAPSPLPANVPSVGFEATATSEFGTLVRLAGATHLINSVTITMSSHAMRSDFPNASPFGFSHPITLKLYAVDRRDGAPTPGAELASVTQAFLVPWRPEADASLTSPLRPWRANDGVHYSGVAFNITFDFASLASALPAEVIVAVSFNTEHHGATPLGVAGPYNFLHVGVTDAKPTAGTTPEPDAVFWKTALATNYSDHGAAGTNTLRRDTGWSSAQPALRINDSPLGLLSSLATTLRNVPSDDVPTVVALVEASDLITSALDRGLWDGNARLRPLWGRVVFDLLAEAADPLARFANTETAITPQARAALDSLLAAAESLAETAVADALLAGGSAQRILRAQAAFDNVGMQERAEPAERAITLLANAWREAQLSLR